MKVQASLSSLQRYGDIFLALAVVFMVGMLFLPVPTALLDVLIATNLGASLIVLLVALYIPSSARLPSFPTILLLTTLFRLALNVCSTKSILKDGSAGEIIAAFGNLVVGGNFVVGIVIFLVLLIVQFVVINRGAERVAEVSARFSLDALPGRQMTIDADLRNGSITNEQAAERRRELAQESKLYGAMTGAMKFVQGDAIAGLLISIINIVAGIIVGVSQQGLDLAEAAGKYTKLTIGDGLVSQIPSLLICLAAGLVVTRVSVENDQRSGGLAKDLLRQLLDHPRALLVSATFLGLLALSGWMLDGFLPPLPFLALALACAAGGLLPRTPEGGESLAESSPTPASAHGPSEAGPAPIVLCFHPSLSELLLPAVLEHRAQVQASLESLRRKVSSVLGIRLPAISLQAKASLPEDGYQILARDSVIASGSLKLDRCLTTASSSQLTALSIAHEPVPIPGTRALGSSVALTELERLKGEKLDANRPERVLFAHMYLELVRNSHEWVGIQETSDLLETLRSSAPDLVKAVVPVQLSLQQVAQVLKALLREQVPIRDLRGIMEALARWATTVKDPVQLAELVRRENRRALCALLSPDGRHLPLYELEPAIEELLVPALGGRPLSFESRQRFFESTVVAIPAPRHLRRPAVLLVTRTELRPIARRVLESVLPDLHVLAPDEIAPGYIPTPEGRVRAAVGAAA